MIVKNKNMSYKIKKSKQNFWSAHSRLLVLSIVVILISSLFAGLYYLRSDDGPLSQEQATKADDDINYSPPSENDLQKNDELKASIAKNQSDVVPSPDTKNTSSGLKKVKPEIIKGEVYAGNVEVTSRVPGIFENSGTCTLRLTKGSKQIEQIKQASQNVSEMSCGLIKIPKTSLSKGVWVATVVYSSSKAQGISDKLNVEVK